MQHINHVFFDLDHTLWDFEKNSELAFQVVFERNNISVDFDDFMKNYVPINHLYWEKFRKDQVTKEELRLGRLRDSFVKCNVHFADNQLEILASDYLEILPSKNHLFDGAEEILDYLSTKYHLHIITNGFAGVQENKIRNSNISQFFKTVTNSEMAGVKKPNPAIFKFATNLAAAKKNESIMIGDCPIADVQGALDFGMDAILFDENNSLNIDQEIKKINHLLELKNYL